MRKRNFTIVPLIVIALTASIGAMNAAWAVPATQVSATQPSLALTVALLDFAADTPGSPNLGSQITDVLTATLGGQTGYTLVDRSSLTRVLQEHELNLTGLVDTDQAIKVGRLVGAKILVTGKAFIVDKQIFMTAKLIGTETSLVEGILVEGDVAGGMDPLVVQLSQKIASRLPISGPRLVAQDQETLDPLPALKKILAGKLLPRMAVRVSERNIAETPAGQIDPAVATDLKMLLTQAGITVVDGDDTDLAKAGVQIVITGDAFSEFAARIGTLVSCTDRVELKMTQFTDGKVLWADRDNNRAVDLSETLAGKLALQKSARLLGLRMLQSLAESAPAKP